MKQFFFYLIVELNELWMTGQMLEDHLDGDNPRDTIFGINLFGFDNKEILRSYLEDRGYPNADSISAKVFEMKGK